MRRAPERESILVVDDSADTLEVLRRTLTGEGFRVFTAPGVAEALDVLGSTAVDLVITDFKMAGLCGLDLIRHVRENLKDTGVIMITGYPSVTGAVEAVKTGAEEYLAKPFTDEELLAAVQRTLEALQERRSRHSLVQNADGPQHGLIGASKAMRQVFAAIDKVAPTSGTVLITGESGTGKELVARAVHYNSPRVSAPFVPVNCGGIPEGLLESELFGHVKGAFTGALESRAGFFHAADGGTLFLDEIAETSLSMQVKLLRVLEEKEICMVGSNQLRQVDVRILAATNKDLFALVKKGSFREDLFYRLNVLTITIPPLRERQEDILLVAHHFAARFAEETGKPPCRFSDEATKVLMSYDWPGNVRELKNVVQRLVLMADDETIDVPDLPALMRFSALRERGYHRTLAEVENEYILNVLNSVGGNKTQAADILGIDRKTLRERLKSIGQPAE